jgi:predicted nuclease of predicted toxin-antitoxin system
VKFLVDECLSEELAKLARGRDHADSSHVRWIGKGQWKDWQLLPVILDGDWVFVTKNSVDFRGHLDASRSKGLYGVLSLHAGLVCINGPVGMDLDLQLRLFSLALDELDRDDNLVNQVLEVTATEGDTSEEIEVEILRYRLPSTG